MKNKLFLIPLLWLFLGPMVAALTIDDVPNILRSLVMLPGLIMITAYGLYEVWWWVKKKYSLLIRSLFLFFFALALCWNFSYFLHQYFIHGQFHRPWYRFDGLKEMVLAVSELMPNYDKVLVTKDQGGIYISFLFFQKFDPKEYQKLGSPKDKDNQGFGKLVFVSEQCPKGLLESTSGKKEKILYVTSKDCRDSQFSPNWEKIIYREDKTVAFRIYSNF